MLQVPGDLAEYDDVSIHSEQRNRIPLSIHCEGAEKSLNTHSTGTTGASRGQAKEPAGDEFRPNGDS